MSRETFRSYLLEYHVSSVQLYFMLQLKAFSCYQAFQDAWEIACSSPSRANIVVPDGQFIVGPINFTGPCTSKVSLRVSGDVDSYHPLQIHYAVKFRFI